MAKLYAASLPLGNIIPYMSSVTDSLSLGKSSALVPPRNGVVLNYKILTSILSGFKPCFSIIFMMTLAVMILVKLATYLF
jgi:hypothetical protein